MQIKKWSAKMVLLGLLATISVSSIAATQHCGLLQNCSAQVAVAPAQKVAQQKNKETKSADLLAYYLDHLQFTPDQIVMLRKIQESQVPLIMLSKRNLEDAHAKLRDMAMKNAYDQSAADQIAQTIANHTANLAVLQAQREYEIFSMLNDEQVRLYQALATQVQ